MNQPLSRLRLAPPTNTTMNRLSRWGCCCAATMVFAVIASQALLAEQPATSHSMNMKEKSKTVALDLSAAVNKVLGETQGDKGGLLNLAKDGAIDISGFTRKNMSIWDLDFKLHNSPVTGCPDVVGLRAAEPTFAESVEIEVGRKAAWVYLLHAGTFMADKGPVGTLEFVYTDGSVQSVEILNDRNLTPFRYGGPASEAKRLTVSGTNPNPSSWIFVYAAPIKNPASDKAIKSLRLRAEGTHKDRPLWMVLAISLGDGENLLAKPESIELKVDATSPQGKIRRLHGTNLGPSLQMENLQDNTADLKALDIPLMRLSDVPWEQGGVRLVDVHHIFPLFHLDPKDPANYYFPQTDDYIAKCLSAGAKILYRLGTTIEHSKKKYFAFPPADYAKWSEICCNIIAHYNEGWDNGFHYNIEYWEIWNEANIGAPMWSGTWEDYIRLYITASKTIKSRFPKVKVGGPAVANLPLVKIEAFLEACQKENAPLDFFSWHSYSPNLETDLLPGPTTCRRLLDKYGFAKTELHLNEWHYPGIGSFSTAFNPAASAESKRLAEEDMNGPDAAAYTCAVLSGLQDTPVDMANFYTASGMAYFGIFDIYGGKKKCYYALSAFNRITKYPKRVKATAVDDKGNEFVKVLAGLNDHGSLAVLVSCNFTGKCKIKLDVEGMAAKDCAVSVIDAAHDLTPLSKPVVREGSNIILEKPEEGSVFLLEFK